MVYRFGPFELDESLYELRREGTDLRLRRRSFEVLRLLIDERARVVGKDELLDRIWGRRFVSQSALANCISELRAAFGGELEASAIIRTVYGRGYRFVAKLEEPESAVAFLPAPSPIGVSEVSVSPREIFVGRARELERLESALEAARGGSPQIALLIGEAGIGKSATASRFAAQARARSVRVLSGSCSDNGVAPIGWPWPRILRSLLGDDAANLADDEAAAMSRLLPELRPRVTAGGLADHSDESQTRLYEVATRLLVRAAAALPLLVIVDDVHLADSTSMNLLGFFASQLAELPIMLLCTMQPPGRAVSRPFARMLADLTTRQATSHSLELAPLTREEVEEIVERSSVGAAPKLAKRIFERSEGNPLFVSQLLRLVEDHPGSEADEIALPPGLSATIALRLSRLTAECRALLGVASAIGRSFRTHLLQRASALGPRECLDLLQEAADARLIEETSTPGASESFRFRHGLIRAGVYQAIAAGERAEIHRRVGVALRGSEAKVSDEIAAYLAYHYYQSHDLELGKKAIHYGERAARYAARQGDYYTAAAHFTRVVGAAIELGIDSLRICDLQLAASVELRRSIQHTRADAMLAQAIERARSLKAFDRLAGAALAWGGVDTIGSADPAWCRLIDEALAGVGRDQGPARASLLVAQTIARLAADPAEVNEARMREAIAIAEGHKCWPVLKQAQSLFFALVRGPEQSDEIRGVIDAYFAAANTSANPMGRNIGVVGSIAHRIEWLRPEEETSGLDTETRYPALVAARITRNLMRAKLDDAERDIEFMWREWLPMPTNGRLPLPLVAYLFGLRREQARLTELDVPVRAALQRNAEVTVWSVFYSLLLAETGRAAEAVDVLAGLTRDGFKSVPRNGYWLGNAMYAAEAAAAIGHAESADVLYPLLTPFENRGALMCKVACAGPVALGLGRLATLRGDFAAAESHLESAERACQTLGATSFELRSRMARADLFAARGARARAESLRRETRAQAHELGLRGLIHPG